MHQKSEVLSERHYYLYAKGHYERSDDLYADLSKIHGAWCNCEPERIKKWHIHQKLIELVFVTIKTDPNSFQLFSNWVRDMAPENRWNVHSMNTNLMNMSVEEQSNIESDDYWISVTKKSLQMLANVKVKNREGNIILNLGQPDPTILPLSKK